MVSFVSWWGLKKRSIYFNTVSISIVFNQLALIRSGEIESGLVLIRYLTGVNFYKLFNVVNFLVSGPIAVSGSNFNLHKRLSVNPGIIWKLLRLRGGLGSICLNYHFRYVNFRLSSLFSSARANNYISTFGVSDRVEVTGYSRKMWLSSKKGVLFLQIGKSFISKILIPRGVRIVLLRRRVLLLYSNNLSLINFISLSIWNLRPADPYKSAGILLQSKPVNQKKKKK